MVGWEVINYSSKVLYKTHLNQTQESKLILPILDLKIHCNKKNNWLVDGRLRPLLIYKNQIEKFRVAYFSEINTKILQIRLFENFRNGGIRFKMANDYSVFI